MREFAARAELCLVRAADAPSAYAELERDRFAFALFDLDALGGDADDFLSRVRGLQPELRAAGYGRLAGSRPGAQRAGYPLLSKPLTRAGLERVLAASLQAPGLPSPLAASLVHRAAAPRATARRPGGGAPSGERSAQPPAAAPPEPPAAADALRTRVAQLTTLYQIGRAISESRDWSEALDYFLATLRDYLHVRGAAILLYSRAARVLAPRTVLCMAPDDVQASTRVLLEAYPAGNPLPEMHALDCYAAGRGVRCTGHAGRWRLTVLPLLYRRAPLGFLLLDKDYEGAAAFAAERFFLQTIQTVLAEEVANAVHLSRLVDLKNFNEAVLDNVESGVLTANEAGEIGFVNRRARQILGLPPGAEPPPGLHFDALVDVPAAGGPIFARILGAEPAGASFEGEVRRLDAGRVPVRLRTSRIRNPSDRDLLFVVGFEDLREQRLLEEQARRADRLRSLGELSAAIAHEVRNPLQGISLTLSNLQEFLQPGAEPYVQVMFSEMERLNALVGGILAFARPQPPLAAPANLVPLCQRALELVAERAARRRVTLVLDAGVADDACELDEGQILQVLLNLLRNGIDAAGDGGRVVLHLEPAATSLLPVPLAAGPWWRFVVHDNGPGIPEDVRAKIFDPFFTTKSDGTGLGLAVCQKIVEEHRGSLHLDSRAGAGTTFTVELPRRFAPAASTSHEGA